MIRNNKILNRLHTGSKNYRFKQTMENRTNVFNNFNLTSPHLLNRKKSLRIAVYKMDESFLSVVGFIVAR